MQSITAGKIPIFFTAGEETAAELIRGVCEQTLRLVRENWGLAPPEDCRIHVMTSGPGFMFQAAPGLRRIYLAATFPLWVFHVRRMWPISGGWTLRFGRRTAIGIKPPRLMIRSDRRIGERIFVEEKDPVARVRTTACHELTHACASGLALPMWLNEGVAMLTVDRCLGRPTVRRDTLSRVREYFPKRASPGYREIQRMGDDAMVYHTSRGYWLTNYLEAARPGFLRTLFARRRDETSIERETAAALGMAPETFWRDIDGRIAAHFSAES
jgi:hypothetical protein